MNRFLITLSCFLLLAILLVSCEKKGNEPPEIDAVSLTIDQTTLTPTSIDLYWTRTRVANFLQYEIHYSKIHNFTPSPVTLYEILEDRDETSDFVTDLTPSTTYYFKVRVVTRDGRYQDSNEAGASTDAPPPEITVRFIHAAKTLGTVGVVVTGSFIDSLGFEQATLYRTFSTGLTGVSLYANGARVDSSTLNFVPSAKGTVFILDTPTPSSPRMSFLFERSIFDPPAFSGTSIIRFVNASLHLDSASVHVALDGSIIDGVVAFGKAGSYSTKPGRTYQFYVTLPRDSTAIGSTLSSAISNSHRYTIAALDSMPAPHLKVYTDD